MLTNTFSTASYDLAWSGVRMGSKRVQREPAAEDVEIRRPDETDLPGICHCLRDHGFHMLGDGPTADPDFPQDVRLSVHNAVREVNLEEKCWVAIRDGEVLGFCSWAWQDYSRRIAKTVVLSVLCEVRRLGLDRWLLSQNQEEISAEGGRELHVWSDDPKAIAWYQQRLGYTLVGPEPLNHCLHRFHCGDQTVWGIHRGRTGRDQLAHLRVKL